MAVLLETSKGDIVIDLFCDACPVASKNFLKLCKVKYYNNCLFHNVQRNFIAQTGDPTGTGRGGSSAYGLMYGDQARVFESEIRPELKHSKRGTVGMASGGSGANASQFYITLADELDSLDEKHTIFGQVGEGFDVLDKLNDAFVDADGRPYQNIRVRHTVILDDPYEDPPELLELIPEASPEPEFAEGDRLGDDWKPTEDTRPEEEIEAETRALEAHSRAVVLEMVGDLPDADAKPPANMLFMCKLNPVTSEEDLEIIFSRFGHVTSCDIIRDIKTGDSLCFGFVGFDTEEACEAAYFKMNNVLIDDRRIKVDFSQSVSHLWRQFKKGGRKGGNSDMMKEANDHQRGGPPGKAAPTSSRLELRPTLGHSSRPELPHHAPPHGAGRGAHGGGGGGGHDSEQHGHGHHGGREAQQHRLLLDEPMQTGTRHQQAPRTSGEADRHPRPEPPARSDHKSSRRDRSRSRSRSRERGVSKHVSKSTPVAPQQNQRTTGHDRRRKDEYQDERVGGVHRDGEKEGRHQRQELARGKDRITADINSRERDSSRDNGGRRHADTDGEGKGRDRERSSRGIEEGSNVRPRVNHARHGSTVEDNEGRGSEQKERKHRGAESPSEGRGRDRRDRARGPGRDDGGQDREQRHHHVRERDDRR